MLSISQDILLQRFQKRGLVAFGSVIFAFLLIALRLWYLQIILGDELLIKSENNRVRSIFIPASRGLIKDRNGVLIASNRPSFNVELIPEDCPDVNAVLKSISEITGNSIEDLELKLKVSKKRKKYEPRIILRDASRDLIAKISAKKDILPGIVINPAPIRLYNYPLITSHILGYLREISPEQLEKPEFSKYLPGDLVGTAGIEEQNEAKLQGIRGFQKIIVNAVGSKIGDESIIHDEAGKEVNLSIDLDLQQVAYDAMGDNTGVVVAMQPKTGEVLALVSKPGYDANLLSGAVDPNYWKKLITDKDKPLTDKAVQGTYPPGSVFKVFTALAGLKNHLITPNTKAFCPGFYTFGGRPFKCHKKSGHGTVGLYEALVQSCDVYFYSLASRMNIDTIANYLSPFGFGTSTNLGIGFESQGILPSTAWKKKAFKRPEMQTWFPGETLSVIIGQGAVTVTPMQVTKAMAILANGGHLINPTLIKDQNHETSETTASIFSDSEKSNVEAVKKALMGVVSDQKGTGHKASLHDEFNIDVAGKSGTAQVASLHLHNNGDFNDHAWFSAYAPANDPEIVVTTLIENGGHGGSVSAPVVKAVMEKFFEKNGRINLKKVEKDTPVK